MFENNYFENIFKTLFPCKLVKSYNILIGNEYMNCLLSTGRLGSIGSLFKIIKRRLIFFLIYYYRTLFILFFLQFFLLKNVIISQRYDFLDCMSCSSVIYKTVIQYQTSLIIYLVTRNVYHQPKNSVFLIWKYLKKEKTVKTAVICNFKRLTLKIL